MIMEPDAVSIADFPGFTNAVLAEFCRAWPGTNEARAARAELISRKALVYAEFCCQPWLCIAKGWCPRNPTCAD
jgi:hypothetical protein